MRLVYLSHPEVVIDQGVPVPDWALSSRGIARTVALARRWHLPDARLLSSPERKAQETASILAHIWGSEAEVLEGSGEVDRSATGYVPPEQHEALAEALFAQPEVSLEGWERAIDAQRRMVALLTGMEGTVLMIGHGGVGTLLYCHLADLPISRAQDQQSMGNIWQLADGKMLHGWRRFEAMGE